MNRVRSLLTPRAVLVGLAIGVGCGGSGSGIPVAGITQTVGSAGAAITISASGEPDIAGTTLIIPANALTSDTVITVSKGTDEAKSGEMVLGPSVRFSPDGLVFKVPAMLILPFRPASQPQGTAIAVAVVSGSVRSEITGGALVVDAMTNSVTTNISHFTDYQVLAVPGESACAVSSDCAGGQVCVASKCQSPNSDGGTGCQTNSDCAKGSVCVSGTCRSQSVDGGGSDGSHDGGNSDGGVPDGAPTDLRPFDGGNVDLP